MLKNKSNGSTISNELTRQQLVTVADLENFKDELLSALKTILSQYVTVKQKKWLKSYQVKKLMGISHGTLQTLRNNGTIPFNKVGGTIYYDEDEITEAIRAQNKKRAKYAA